MLTCKDVAKAVAQDELDTGRYRLGRPIGSGIAPG